MVNAELGLEAIAWSSLAGYLQDERVNPEFDSVYALDIRAPAPIMQSHTAV